MLKTYKRCTLKVPHEPFYPHNMCGATFFARFPQCFYAFSMRKQHEPFYQRNLCKKDTNPSILPSLRWSDGLMRVWVVENVLIEWEIGSIS
jgi:hypothetical protein